MTTNRIKPDGKFAEGKIECLECGNWYLSVGDHVKMAHGMTAREYKIKHCLPLKKSLSADELKARRRQIALDNKKFLAAGTDIQTNVQGLDAADYNFKLSGYKQKAISAGAHAARSKLKRRWADADFEELERRAAVRPIHIVCSDPDMPSVPTYRRWLKTRRKS